MVPNPINNSIEVEALTVDVFGREGLSLDVGGEVSRPGQPVDLKGRKDGEARDGALPSLR